MLRIAALIAIAVAPLAAHEGHDHGAAPLVVAAWHALTTPAGLTCLAALGAVLFAWRRLAARPR